MTYPPTMVRRMTVCAAMLAIVGCGSTTIVEGDPDGSSSSSSASSSATSGTGGATSGTGGTTGTGGTSGEGGAGAGTSDGPWRADMWIGQVDHMSIRHHAIEADVCLLLTATAPSQNTTYDIAIPEPWAIDMISVYDETEGCLEDPFTPADEPAFASEALGTITFDVPAMQFYPCEIDVDIDVVFGMAPGWAPPSLSLATSMLPVGGACN